MPDIENLLREELKHTAQQVQPELLRPLRAPAPGRAPAPESAPATESAPAPGRVLAPWRAPAPWRGWRPRLLPLAAAAAVIAIIAAVALVAGLPASHQAATTRSAPAALPRFYVTILNVHYSQAVKVEAVVRASASGNVTGTVTVPWAVGVNALTLVTAAADDRSFILSAYRDQSPDNVGGGFDVRLFRLGISADGKPGHLTELAAAPLRTETTQGIALSPNGKLLAVSLTYEPLGPDYIGTLEVINLATGATRTWSAPAGRNQYYVPGPPSWADGNRMVAFTWLRTSHGGISSVTEGVRLLDTAAPGDNLADAKLIVPSQVDVVGSIENALITPDGRDVLVVALRDYPSPLAARQMVTVQFAELQAGTGRLVRVLRTQTAWLTWSNLADMGGISDVLSLGSSGQYALVRGLQFGWLDVGGPDPGQFQALSAGPASQYAGSAAW
jgi:hypothetical protein